MTLLVEGGVEVPVPAQRAPTAADLRDAMRAQDCAEPFWPDAWSWFYLAADYERLSERCVDGVDLTPGGVGGVSIFPKGTKGGGSHWDGDWSDELAMFSFDRPEAGAALLVIWELARQHGPVVVMAKGDLAMTVARGDESFGEFYRVTDESLFDDE